jgi:hypothetical protein
MEIGNCQFRKLIQVKVALSNIATAVLTAASRVGKTLANAPGRIVS